MPVSEFHRRWSLCEGSDAEALVRWAGSRPGDREPDVEPSAMWRAGRYVRIEMPDGSALLRHVPAGKDPSGAIPAQLVQQAFWQHVTRFPDGGEWPRWTVAEHGLARPLTETRSLAWAIHRDRIEDAMEAARRWRRSDAKGKKRIARKWMDCPAWGWPLAELAGVLSC